jgi:hypothetical protein
MVLDNGGEILEKQKQGERRNGLELRTPRSF